MTNPKNPVQENKNIKNVELKKSLSTAHLMNPAASKGGGSKPPPTVKK